MAAKDRERHTHWKGKETKEVKENETMKKRREEKREHI